ncbi:MAG TPA: protein-glutamate O-methyltransferase [Nitrospiraceae bacterium]|nr:protein-glutamate O-methyltransferase [Nitrospiraceae bacterium]
MTEQQHPLNDDVFERFRALVYRECGINLTDHKRALFNSRLQKRLRQLGLTSFQDYYDLVVGRCGDAELTTMLDYISTNHTEFFREPHHFTFLRERVLHELAGDKTVRIWSTACSSGEEPYSIAMTLSDAIASPSTWNCRILASDISTRMLAKAAAGQYSHARVNSLPPDLVRRHFLLGKGDHRELVKIKSHVADMAVFRRINLMDDRYPIKSLLDVIFCRNVIIYFDRETQAAVLARLSRYLKPGGYLFMGHSETLHGISDVFHYVAPTIYRKQE